MTPKRKPETYAVGDLVSFSFPYSGEGSKTRICAIVGVDEVTGDVVVAYGTSNIILKHNPAHALVVLAKTDWRAAGLRKATRFQLDRRIRVSADDPRFRKNATLGTAKVGCLGTALSKRLGTIYERLPQVSLAQEKLGVHPVSPMQASRRTFLGRRQAA